MQMICISSHRLRVSCRLLLFLIATALPLLQLAASEDTGAARCSATIFLQEEDLARFEITVPGRGYRAVATAADGSIAKRAALNNAVSLFYFVASVRGGYSVTVTGPDGREPSGCALRDLGTVSAEARVRGSVPRGEGVEIVHLRRALADGAPGAVEAFWRMVEQRGTPLMEPVPAAVTPNRVLCTFVWRGNERTRDVLVNLLPYSRIDKDLYHMEQIGHTGVWFTTVELPARSRLLYQLAVNPPPVAAAMTNTADENESFFATVRLDPFNQRRWPEDPDAPARVVSSVVEMPGAAPFRWLERSPGTPAGRVESRIWKSQALGNERMISVYMPPGGVKPRGVLVLFDGDQYTSTVPVPVILDNLLAAGRIPPLAVLFIGNAPGARPAELPCNPAFAAFVREELLPWFRDAYDAPSDPARTIAGGSSYGGLAAVYAAIQSPDTFGNVISQSGSFWWTPPSDRRKPFQFDPDAAPDYVAAMVLARPRLPVRFYFDAGAAEVAMPGHPGGILDTTRHLRDVLLAKGNQVFYHEFAGGHGALSWRLTFPDALLRITGSWTSERNSRPHD